MGRRIPKWNQKKLDERSAQGYGQGRGKGYKPWQHSGIRSKGELRHSCSQELKMAPKQPSSGATSHSTETGDFNHQVPLGLQLTGDIARALGIRHPRYGSGVRASGLTPDLLVQVQGAAFVCTLKPQSGNVR